MFKIGDTVTCVDNEDMEHTIYVGASYTVSGITLHGDLVSLDGFNDDDMFCSSRFVLGNEILSPFQQWEKEYA